MSSMSSCRPRSRSSNSARHSAYVPQRARCAQSIPSIVSSLTAIVATTNPSSQRGKDSPSHTGIIYSSGVVRSSKTIFLIPEYLQLSIYRKPDTNVRESIRRHAMRTLYRDAANLVIVDLCSRVRSTAIDLFGNHLGLETKAAARKSLLARQDLNEFAASAGQLLSQTTLGDQFDQAMDRMTGPLTQQPPDFQELHRLISNRLAT